MKFRIKTEAKLAVEILQKVHDVLPEEFFSHGHVKYSPYICDTIRAVTYNMGSIACEIGSEIRVWIRTLLQDQFSLETWLSTFHDTVVDRDSYSDRIKLQETRKQWILWMISEIKSVNKI